jgi:hypothetical protein
MLLCFQSIDHSRSKESVQEAVITGFCVSRWVYDMHHVLSLVNNLVFKRSVQCRAGVGSILCFWEERGERA